jgi:hypothetical protein
MSLTQGYFKHNDAKIEVIGSDNNYRYRWSLDKDHKTNYENCTAVMMLDFSWSMYHSGSALPSRDACIKSCEKLYNMGMKKVVLCFWGRTANLFETNGKDYKDKISTALANYFNSDDVNGNRFDLNGSFNACGTYATVAYESLLSYMTNDNNKDGIYSVLFLTDGIFNEHSWKSEYATKWDSLAKEFLKLTSNMSIHAIGYRDDKLEQIKEMHKSFGKNEMQFTYKTIQDHNEI